MNHVNDAVDMNNNDLVMVLLARACLKDGGKQSKNRHKQRLAKGHPSVLLDQSQQAVLTALEALDGRN